MLFRSDIENAFHLDYQLLGHFPIENSSNLNAYFGFGETGAPYDPAAVCGSPFDTSARIARLFNESSRWFRTSKLYIAELETLEAIQKRMTSHGSSNDQLDHIIGIIREIDKNPEHRGRITFWLEY